MGNKFGFSVVNDLRLVISEKMQSAPPLMLKRDPANNNVSAMVFIW